MKPSSFATTSAAWRGFIQGSDKKDCKTLVTRGKRILRLDLPTDLSRQTRVRRGQRAPLPRNARSSRPSTARRAERDHTVAVRKKTSRSLPEVDLSA